jgi:hypothetical protein
VIDAPLITAPLTAPTAAGRADTVGRELPLGRVVVGVLVLGLVVLVSVIPTSSLVTGC